MDGLLPGPGAAVRDSVPVPGGIPLPTFLQGEAGAAVPLSGPRFFAFIGRLSSGPSFPAVFRRDWRSFKNL